MIRKAHARLPGIYFLSLLFFVSALNGQEKNGFIRNPIVDGYYADPTIIK